MYGFIGLATVVLVCYALYSWAIIISDWRKAKLLGCQAAHQQKNRLPLGWDQLQRFDAADKAGCLPEEGVKMFAEEGCRTFSTSMLGSTFLQTVEPKNIQALLATQFKDFSLGDLRRRTFFPFLGNGIFTADGKLWYALSFQRAFGCASANLHAREHSRSMLRPQFARAQVADLDDKEKHLQELLQLLPAGRNGWTEPTNITPMFFRLTFDSATEFFFGMSVHSQSQALAEFTGQANVELLEWRNLAKSFDAGTKHLGDRSRLLEFYWLHNPKDFRDSIKEVHRFADFCVREALQRTSQTKQEAETHPASTSNQKYTFLDELAKVTKDPVELRSQLMNILLAGRDTTASLLSWTFWLLAYHPDIFHKLRSRILDDFGPYEQTDRITFSSLKSCVYLQYVMKEVLRLYPPVPINARSATKDTTLPLGGGPDGKSPVFVKKGQEVGYYVCVTHRMKEFWGEDADEFNPDRWTGRKNGWEYLPFNGGPRICLGQQLALTEAGYVLTRMLQRFDRLELEDGNTVPAHRLGVTDAPHDYLISLRQAN